MVGGLNCLTVPISVLVTWWVLCKCCNPGTVPPTGPGGTSLALLSVQPSVYPSRLSSADPGGLPNTPSEPTHPLGTWVSIELGHLITQNHPSFLGTITIGLDHRLRDSSITPKWSIHCTSSSIACWRASSTQKGCCQIGLLRVVFPDSPQPVPLQRALPLGWLV